MKTSTLLDESALTNSCKSSRESVNGLNKDLEEWRIKLIPTKTNFDQEKISTWLTEAETTFQKSRERK